MNDKKERITMPDYIKENYTHYSTEDLNTLCCLAQEALEANPSSRLPAISAIKVEYLTEENNYAGAAPVHRQVAEGNCVQDIHEARGFAFASSKLLRLAHPDLVLEYMTTLERLARVKDTDVWEMPLSFSRDIVDGLVARQCRLQGRYYSRDLVSRAQHFLEGTDFPLVRVGEKAERAKTRKKLTVEQSIARYRKLYGEGGTLCGPEWAWASGRRASTYKWETRISDAQEYYEREKAARDKYREKLERLGVEPTPYLTYPEYLRKVADDLEAEVEANRQRWVQFKEQS